MEANLLSVAALGPAAQITIQGHLDQCVVRVHKIGAALFGDEGPWRITKAAYECSKDGLCSDGVATFEIKQTGLRDGVHRTT